MVSHVVEMAPAAAGFKLFGKVIRRASASPDGGAASSSRGGAPAASQAFSSGRASVEQLEEAARARAAAAEARLPCPRCRSEDTKFCYFNNYNVNQPRHFCRACHRYWTAGGAIRNVPVGSGRRKNRPPPPLPHGTASAAEYHRLLQAPGSMSPAPAGLTLGFPPDHHQDWSRTTSTPSPAYSYTGHGEMEQYRWFLLHAERPPVGSSSDRAF